MTPRPNSSCDGCFIATVCVMGWPTKCPPGLRRSMDIAFTQLASRCSSTDVSAALRAAEHATWRASNVDWWRAKLTRNVGARGS